MAYRLGPAVLLKADSTSWTGATLNGALTASDTTITFSGGSGTLPDSGIVTIESEQIFYTAKTSTTLTGCVRGFYSTTAATHVDTTSISLAYASLGKTFGGVTVELAETSNKLQTDQDGESPVDEVITGTTATIKGSLADITLENFATIHKTSVVGTSPNRKVIVYSNAGASLKTNALKLLLVPYAGTAVTTESERCIIMPSAGIRASETLTYDANTQRILEFEATSFVSSGNQVLIIGDENAS